MSLYYNASRCLTMQLNSATQQKIHIVHDFTEPSAILVRCTQTKLHTKLLNIVRKFTT